MNIRYAVAVMDSEEFGNIMWLCGDATCRHLIALTMGTPPDHMTAIQPIGTIRRPDADRDDIPAYGMRDRVRRKPWLAKVYESAARRSLTKATLEVLDRIDLDSARTDGRNLQAQVGRAYAKGEYALLFIPDLFDTWCSRCGARNRVDLDRARRLPSAIVRTS